MSHNDKRTPHTDALETLGMIHTRIEKRDAIHLAVEPVMATQKLQPGEFIRIRDGSAYPAPAHEAHGIVDPFLIDGPHTGEFFWFVMKPREVSSLRHVWTHPDFPDEV